MSAQDERRTEHYLAIVASAETAPELRNEAAASLVRRLTPIIRGIVARHGIQPDRIDDAVGDLCLRIIQDGLKYDPARGGRFRDLVAACARNWARQHHRVRQTHKGADVGAADSVAAARLAEHPDRTDEDFSSILSDLIDSEMRAALREATAQALEELDEEERGIVRAYLEGCPSQEIAEREHRPFSAVRKITWRFRGRVKALVLSGGPGADST
jgi:RNA polymerase sigma factor (sigma-70 family)